MFGLFEMDALRSKHIVKGQNVGSAKLFGCIYRQIEATKNVPSPKLGEVEQKTREVVITSCQFHYLGYQKFL